MLLIITIQKIKTKYKLINNTVVILNTIKENKKIVSTNKQHITKDDTKWDFDNKRNK
jgi:hypothetical protein